MGATTALADTQSTPAAAGSLQPAVSIIIDDLGNQQRSGLRAIDLPGPVTYAILPHRPFTRLLARHAHRQNKEVMIHLPMEAETGAALGPGGAGARHGRATVQNRGAPEFRGGTPRRGLQQPHG
ncbi:divergent polysaccharide deacetylase family protein [Thiohalophilus sp.]|uniref:divergent polysaccharide deacetylase family protein n=1 Tax=Thiohalophilus sp. TaxID=3028392 RepID=UPI002ACE3986|nr:divergent polysaccharide deacetylase family protein [Thiohalophilus sp.]MDZ7803432.1 divergent polysaccharide deacetylase family protein [Thiohalophilus sp.]